MRVNNGKVDETAARTRTLDTALSEGYPDPILVFLGVLCASALGVD
jgi:hypothetical protein